MRLEPEAIAEAFNVNCPKKYWSARIVRTQTGGVMREAVSFRDRSGLITLIYDVDSGSCRKFGVQFNRAVAAWGDYCNAIGKGLHTVLTALQAGGLPFVAPVALDTIIVRTAFAGVGGNVTVEIEPAGAAQLVPVAPLDLSEPVVGIPIPPPAIVADDIF